jgi:hypothetical protein
MGVRSIRLPVMQLNPFRYRRQGTIAPTASNLGEIAFAGVSLLVLSGALVMVVANPRWTARIALVVVVAMSIRNRVEIPARPSLPTGTLQICLPFGDVCIEGRVSREAGVTD